MFTTDELAELAPVDLAELIRMADGSTPEECATTLGMDLSDPEQRQAVERAVEAAGWDTVPEGRVIGADQDHIRENLMSDETAGQDPTPGGDVDVQALTDALTDELSGEQPALGEVEDLTSALMESAASGRPFIAGTFAAYATPEGGVCLVTENPTGDIRRDMFPPRMVRLVLGMMNGKAPRGLGMISKMMARRGQ